MLVGLIYKRLLLPSMFWRARSRAQPHIPHLWTRLACNLGLIGGRASVDGVIFPSCLLLHGLETCWEGAFLNAEGANGTNLAGKYRQLCCPTMVVETTFFELIVECGSPTADLVRALNNHWAAQAKHNQHTTELLLSFELEAK